MMGVERRRPRGLSLMEAVIAIFVITFAILIMASLFRSALDGARRARKVTVANVLANRRMEEIVYWAGDGNNFSNWSSIDGASGPDGQFPDFTVRSDTEAYVLYSPCSQSESRFPPASQRSMVASARKVRVRVTWSPVTNPRNSIDLLAIVGAPTQKLNSVQIGAPATVAALTSANITATALDTNNQPILDLFFKWSISPLDGYGEIQSASDGRTLTLTNRVYNPDLGYVVAPGNVSLSLSSTSMGLTQRVTQEIYMQP